MEPSSLEMQYFLGRFMLAIPVGTVTALIPRYFMKSARDDLGVPDWYQDAVARKHLPLHRASSIENTAQQYYDMPGEHL